jgi:predicted translin family RNA/ssDNA-binding protein
MRLAIGRISDGEVEYAKNICSFVRDIYRELTLVVPLMDANIEMKKKMEVMLQSVVKIENGITLLMPNNINIVICRLLEYNLDQKTSGTPSLKILNIKYIGWFSFLFTFKTHLSI